MVSRVWFLIAAILIILFVSLAVVRRANADGVVKNTTYVVKNTTNKVFETAWLHDRAIKYGLITTFSIAQGTTGLIESAKYGGHYLSNNADDYHVFRGVQNIAWIGTGWFIYAEKSQQGKPWWAKTSRVIGAACYARDANELVYRWNRTGSPFCYSSAYSSNKKALVLLKWDGAKGRFVDFYVSGVGKQGAFIDASFAIAGFIFNRIGDMR